MIRNYVILSIALLAIVPFLVLDVSAQAPPSGVITIPVPSDFPSGEIKDSYLSLDSDINAGITFQYFDLQTAIFKPNHWSNPGEIVRRQGTAEPRVGEVFAPSSFTILTNPIVSWLGLSFCDNFEVKNLTDMITISNIQPTNPIGLGYVFGNFYPECNIVYDRISDYPFMIDKELRFTIYGKYDKKAYYISPRDNVTLAQPIPACTLDTIYPDNQTLKGDTKMCYGVNGTNMVIITKRLSGYYGAADSITPPTNPIDLDSSSPSLAVTTSRQDVSDINSLNIFNITSGYQKRDHYGTALLDTHSKHTYATTGNTQKGHVYISPATFISVSNLNQSPFRTSDSGKDCVRGHVVSTAHADFALPSNVSEGIAYGFAYTNGTDTCTYNSNSMARQFNVNPPLRIVLYDQAGKQAYSYLPFGSITAAQDIVKCSTNFDNSTKIPLGNTKQCYQDVGNDLVIYSEVMQWYGARSPTDTSDDDDNMANAPSFGVSPLTGEQLVTCGYKMDDTCRDITAYHVQYERDIIQTNTTHTFALKALAPNMIDSFTLAFGVPEVGSPINAAEAYITAKLGVNYTSPSYYNINEITVHDPNNIIDYDISLTEISRVSCSGGALECTQITFPDVLFRDTLYHEPFVVMITDTLLYTSINYMNEGILVTGTPLNKQPTVQPGITVDTDDIRPTKLVLIRTDKVNDLWADAFGNTWSRNSFGNYVIVEYAPYTGTVPVCKDINDRLCAPFKAKLDWHNQRMIELRDSLYTAYATQAYAEIDNIFAYEFGDLDSRTRTLINLGWLTE